ncbi:MAG: hypothetical protein KH135_06015 [Firmicutes bacterium]|nr:hypothetical protein [Bacillota bacterium]
MDLDRNKTFMLIIAILTLVIASLGGYIVFDKYFKGYTVENEINEEEPASKDKEKLDSLKIDKTKAYVYHVKYTGDNEKIELPMINLNSQEAKATNDAIKLIYDQLVQQKAIFELNQSGTVSSEYHYTVNGSILSVMIHTRVQGTDTPVENYYAYNFNLTTGGTYSYQDIYLASGATNTNIHSKVETAISEYMEGQNDKLWETEAQKQTYIKNSIQKYYELVNANQITAYLDKNKSLRVITTILLPAGQETFQRVLEIK